MTMWRRAFTALVLVVSAATGAVAVPGAARAATYTYVDSMERQAGYIWTNGDASGSMLNDYTRAYRGDHFAYLRARDGGWASVRAVLIGPPTSGYVCRASAMVRHVAGGILSGATLGIEVFHYETWEYLSVFTGTVTNSSSYHEAVGPEWPMTYTGPVNVRISVTTAKVNDKTLYVDDLRITCRG